MMESCAWHSYLSAADRPHAWRAQCLDQLQACRLFSSIPSHWSRFRGDCRTLPDYALNARVQQGCASSRAPPQSQGCRSHAGGQSGCWRGRWTPPPPGWACASWGGPCCWGARCPPGWRPAGPAAPAASGCPCWACRRCSREPLAGAPLTAQRRVCAAYIHIMCSCRYRSAHRWPQGCELVSRVRQALPRSTAKCLSCRCLRGAHGSRGAWRVGCACWEAWLRGMVGGL